MPQTTRKEVSAQRAQDKEAKRARGALSCAECRRLKLKCDKTVPCSSCKRRGCSAICPNGSLITGQGTRFVLADTEKLHQKIAQMSDRIRQLEDALAILQSTHTREPHPLLHRDLLKIKSSLELHAAVDTEDVVAEQEEADESQYIDAFGTLAIRDDGAATFYGRSAGSESLLIGETSPPPEQGPSRQNPSLEPDLPPSIRELSFTFPFASSISGLNLDYIVNSFLPPWDEARRLCELYLEQAPWFFGAVTKRQILEEILPLWFQEAPKPPSPLNPLSQIQASDGSQLPTGSMPTNVPTRGTAHDLALLFVIFCFGALTDISLPPAPDNPLAQQYIQLTKAALTLEPVLERPPSVSTVQTLSLMAIYEGLCSGENSIESTWALMGLATKLAQSIGLHRDCARWKLTPAEVQKRRALFWELFITDCWLSLATGRLATFSLPFVDCELPLDPDQTIASDGSTQPSFPFWKARFGAECVAAVVQGTLTSRAPKYSIILQLDRKVRDMDLPKYAHDPPPEDAGLAQTMSRFMPINYRELTLLYIHRCFFAHAITSHPNDPIKSQYAPSFLAGYRSACDLIKSLKVQFSMFPTHIARFWVLWTHSFSAAVMLSSVVIHSSKSKVAPAALLELRTASDLFEAAAKYGGRAVRFLPIIQRLTAKAQKVYLETHSGISPPVANDIFAPSQSDANKDEMSIFSGKTHTLTTKASTSRPPQQTPSTSRSNSHSPRNVTDNPAFADVHPSLVEQLNGFESHIHAQIQNAFQVNQDAFARTLIGPEKYQPQLVQQQHALQVPHTLSSQYQQQPLQRSQSYHHSQYEVHQHHQSQVQIQPQYQSTVQHTYNPPQHQLHRVHTQQDVRQPPLAPMQHVPSHNTTISMEQSRLQGILQPSQRPSLSHTRSHPNMHTSYHHQEQPNQTPIHSLHQQHPHPQHLHSHQSQQPSQQQPVPRHQLYPVAPQHIQTQLDNAMHAPTDGIAQYPTPVSMYDSEPQSHSASQPASAASEYWPATSVAHYTSFQNQYPSTSQQHPVMQQQQYTPAAVMHGIAAEDHSLQETWQSYMNQVGSPPRHLFEE